VTIRILPPELAAKIAAGEVVERPASVVKELIENSIDAGATDIKVEMRDGGIRLVRVADDGCGIPAEEVPLAFARHATSKIQSADDLNRIATLGFRGEALASIAAVSYLTLQTRAAGEKVGTQVKLKGGEIVRQGPHSIPKGTVVTVENIFYNVPARRKFLRRPRTEAGHIHRVVTLYALAYPEIRFTLISDGHRSFQSAGDGELFGTLAQVFGLENARQMIQVSGEDDGIRVSGYVGAPSLHRGDRTRIILFLNRRLIRDSRLSFAVIQAYHTLLPVGRFPFAVLFLEMDPAKVDVNVHPTKAEVRFREPGKVFRTVQKSVWEVLVESSPIPEIAPDVWKSETIPSAEQAILPPKPPPAVDVQIPMDLPTPREETPLAPRGVESPPRWHAPEESERRQEEASPAEKLPPLRVVGQVAATYIVAEGPDGLYLIDQHAAHERILYEQMMQERATGAIVSQGLLQPVLVDIDPLDAASVAENLSSLRRLGFDLEPFGENSFLLRGVPTVLQKQDPVQALAEVARELSRGRNLVEKEREEALIRIVCKRAAVKGGQVLSQKEMVALVRQLEETRSPRTCPHGRPTVLVVSANSLEKLFGRRM
jgi:DNA mismatch repair protein MutL